MSPWTMTKTFVWHLTGRFVLSHDIRPSRVEFWVCLSRVTSSLLFMRRALEAHSLSVLHALAELVEASMDMTGTYQNDDGVPNFGACNLHLGDAASFFFWTCHSFVELHRCVFLPRDTAQCCRRCYLPRDNSYLLTFLCGAKKQINSGTGHSF